jgi:hypothetical protein
MQHASKGRAARASAVVGSTLHYVAAITHPFGAMTLQERLTLHPVVPAQVIALFVVDRISLTLRLNSSEIGPTGCHERY